MQNKYRKYMKLTVKHNKKKQIFFKEKRINIVLNNEIC